MVLIKYSVQQTDKYYIDKLLVRFLFVISSAGEHAGKTDFAG